MSEIPAHLLDAALQLPEDARIELANRLFESLDPAEDEGDVEAAWAEEIKRRLEDLQSGREKAIPLDEAWKIIMDDSDVADTD
jgi:putative addiction module component (TIGR02574 family)